ncbi:hypothetical protein NLG97_g2509 [Lecanicillium saksenae]|uniref:Uncharacterized protein n=1 Tax=Lecanicillium saksenae TaxID=468837 RepID=A0ACC1R2H2_9HYPO|nr:hypothetical protein NLG97_g2509 [Lecanicillium saksenae]
MIQDQEQHVNMESSISLPNATDDIESKSKMMTVDHGLDDDEGLATNPTAATEEEIRTGSVHVPNIANQAAPNGDTSPKKQISAYALIMETLERKRKEKGLPSLFKKPDRSTEIKPGETLLNSDFSRYVIRRDNVAVKYRDDILRHEADAMQFVKRAGMPVPDVISFGERDSGEGRIYIEMSYVEGETLHKAWPSLSHEQRLSIAHQMRDILDVMRALPAPPNFIGDPGHRQARIPPRHRYQPQDCLFACDLAARNIMVRDGRIVALLDWEVAGWYPEYYEYIRFMHSGGLDCGWKAFVDEVFSHKYDDEMVLYTGLPRYQGKFDDKKRYGYEK